MRDTKEQRRRWYMVTRVNRRTVHTRLSKDAAMNLRVVLRNVADSRVVSSLMMLDSGCIAITNSDTEIVGLFDLFDLVNNEPIDS